MFCTPDRAGLQALKDALKSLHQSIIRAWRKVLDPDSNMRLSWVEFAEAFEKIRCERSLPAEIKERMPKTRQDLASAWRALDADCSGWAAMREFDVESFEVLREFKEWAMTHHGSVSKAFHDLDNANGKLTLSELKRGIKPEHNFKGNIEDLFEALDVHNLANLSDNEVKFLDTWDIEWEDWEVQSKHRLDPKVGLHACSGNLGRKAFVANHTSG